MNADQLPARPALAAVLAAVDEITDVAEAWEILDARGLLPPEGRRSFFTKDPRATLTQVRPATVPDLIAWASLGTEAILTAEALCGEACNELASWDIPPCEFVVWRTTDAPLFVGTPADVGGSYWRSDDPTPKVVRAARALWDAGLGLASVGAECVLCVPPVGEGRDA